MTFVQKKVPPSQELCSKRGGAKTMIMKNLTDNTPKHDVQNFGFVRYVDNPSLIHALVNRLLAYGVSQERIEVGDDFRAFIKKMKAGDTVVVNTLFDIATDTNTLISLIGKLFDAGISIISIEDDRNAIHKDETSLSTFIRILRNYIRISGKAKAPVSKAEAKSSMVNGAPSSKANYKDSFGIAYEIWRSGRTMAYAAREAGCSYSAFRYWLRTKKMPHLHL